MTFWPHLILKLRYQVSPSETRTAVKLLNCERVSLCAASCEAVRTPRRFSFRRWTSLMEPTKINQRPVFNESREGGRHAVEPSCYILLKEQAFSLFNPLITPHFFSRINRTFSIKAGQARITVSLASTFRFACGKVKEPAMKCAKDI
ncbi:hypothetical protein SRHO_G00205490 [Serrasalmus rhombeus]